MEIMAESPQPPIISAEHREEAILTAHNLLKEDYWNDVAGVADEINSAITESGEPEDIDCFIGEVIQCHSRVTMLEGAIDCLKFSNFPNAGIFCDTGMGAFDFRYGIPFSDFAFFAFRKDIIQKLKKEGSIK